VVSYSKTWRRREFIDIIYALLHLKTTYNHAFLDQICLPRLCGSLNLEMYLLVKTLSLGNKSDLFHFFNTPFPKRPCHGIKSKWFEARISHFISSVHRISFRRWISDQMPSSPGSKVGVICL
jgi:hypothetical protein